MYNMYGRAWPLAGNNRKKSSIKDSDYFALKLRVSAIRNMRRYDETPSVDAPIVWERMTSGYRIVDLRLDRFMDALKFILNYFCTTEPTCTAVGIKDDAVSMKSVMTKLFKKMETLMSFCAVQEGTDDLVGVLIATPFDKSKWYIQKEQGETLHQIMMLKNYVTAKSQYYGIGSETAVIVDIICVRSDHQSSGIGTALLRSCVRCASYFASTCVGQFTTNAAQTIGKRLNFDIIYELPYRDIGSRKNRFHVFEGCYPRNYSIACMVVRLSPPPMEILLAPPYVSAIKLSKRKLKRDKEIKGKARKSRKKK